MVNHHAASNAKFLHSVEKRVSVSMSSKTRAHPSKMADLGFEQLSTDVYEKAVAPEDDKARCRISTILQRLFSDDF